MKEQGATIALTLPANPSCAAPFLVVPDADGREAVRFDIRRAGADPARREWDDVRQNYLRWAGADGTTPVLEATVAVAPTAVMRADVPRSVTVGAPLALLGPGPHEVRLRVTGARVDLIVDRRLLDENWLCGFLQAPLAAPAGVAVWPRALADGELGLRPEAGVVSGSIAGGGIQYWTPPGHNRWLGDTMMFQDGERLHLLYLLDRRHHGSRGGMGAHQIAHLSTRDLRRWDVHPPAVAITEPWETFGTGSMIRHAGRWWVIHGLHTDRAVRPECVDNGSRTPLPCPFAQLAGLPMGTVAAVSDDGVHFRKSGELLHPAQNPGVFPHPDGGYALFAGYGAEGLYRSDDLRHWRPADPAPFPHGERSPARNTTECICHLSWNGWHYLWGGRTGFWLARRFEGPYWDADGGRGAAVVTPRHDIYDGLWVPMAAPLGDGRRILSGWLEDRGGWGGCLVLRELLQEPDGMLAMRWPAEVVPPVGDALPLAWPSGPWPRRLAATAASAVWAAARDLPEEYLLEVTIAPDGADCVYAVVLGGRGDLIDGCELRFDPRRKVAQWGVPRDGKPAPRVPTAAEILATPADDPLANANLPFHGRDFAITGVEGLDRPLTVRVLVVRDRKSGTTILDAEIGGRRTMITRREGLTGRRLHLVAVAGAAAFDRPVVRGLRRGKALPAGV